MKVLKTIFGLMVWSVFLWTGHASAGSQVGEIPQNFTITRLDGSEFKLSDYRGKKAVNLVFWATWCPGCRVEIPSIKKLHDEYGEQVEVLAISVNGTRKPIPGYVERHMLDYPLAFDHARVIADAFHVRGTPTQILIDKDGVVRYRDATTPSDIGALL